MDNIACSVFSQDYILMNVFGRASVNDKPDGHSRPHFFIVGISKDDFPCRFTNVRP